MQHRTLPYVIVLFLCGHGSCHCEGGRPVDGGPDTPIVDAADADADTGGDVDLSAVWLELQPAILRESPLRNV